MTSNRAGPATARETPDNMAGAEASRWLASKSSAMEESLAPLVEINSFTENTEGGRAVGRGLSELFAIPGLDVRSVPSTKFADHLVAKSRSAATSARQPKPTSRLPSRSGRSVRGSSLMLHLG